MILNRFKHLYKNAGYESLFIIAITILLPFLPFLIFDGIIRIISLVTIISGYILVALTAKMIVKHHILFIRLFRTLALIIAAAVFLNDFVENLNITDKIEQYIDIDYIAVFILSLFSYLSPAQIVLYSDKNIEVEGEIDTSEHWLEHESADKKIYYGHISEKYSLDLSEIAFTNISLVYPETNEAVDEPAFLLIMNEILDLNHENPHLIIYRNDDSYIAISFQEKNKYSLAFYNKGAEEPFMTKVLMIQDTVDNICQFSLT